MASKTVAVCDGQGLKVSVARGHLEIADGSGGEARRYTRAGHGLSRIIIVGHSGSVTLSALQWCSHLGVPIVVIRPDGEILSTSAYGPGGLAATDGRIIRAQALAADTKTGLAICHELLGEKLEGQADVAERQLGDDMVAAYLRRANRVEVRSLRTVPKLLAKEGECADVYFAAWKDVRMRFCERDRVPAHWRRFDSRKSRVRGRNRQASDPVNAILNYTYTIAATECRLACMALGLDPRLGFLHGDEPNRESLVWDLMECVRPTVESWVLALLETHTFTRSDFVETQVGSCRISEPLTHVLAATGPLWWQAVAPHAETVRNMIAETSPFVISRTTRLTSANLREAKGQSEYRAVNRRAFREAYPDAHSCGKCAA